MQKNKKHVPSPTLKQHPLTKKANTVDLDEEEQKNKRISGESYGLNIQPPPNDSTRPTKIIVYFHGNAEDVGISYEFLVKMSVTFKCSILAVEYPGYGIY